MQASATSNAYTTPAAAGSTAQQSSSTLDKDGFLKLLAAQMKNQDPSSGQDPTQYFQTISQMSIVEQLTNLVSQSTDQITSESRASATNLLGRTVSYVGAEGLTITGVVDRVDLGGKKPLISVAGVAGIDPTTLSSVS